MFFLEGGEQPLIEQTNDWVSDSVDFRVMHDFACLPTDYQKLGFQSGCMTI